MTVSTTTDRVQYNGNGTTTVFAFSNKVFSASHLVVTLTSAAGVDTVQTITTNYTVTIASDFNSANVTMNVAPASGEKLTIQRVVPLTQLTDYTDNNDFPMETLERDLDLTAMRDQQVNTNNSLTVKFPATYFGTVPPMPSTVTGDRYLKTNTAGTAFEFGELVGSGVISIPVTVAQGGTGGTTTTTALTNLSSGINGLTYEAAPDGANDALWMWDNSASAGKKIAVQDTLKTIAGLTSKATPVGADILVINDSAASNAPRRTTVTGIFDSLGASASQLIGRGTSGGVAPITLGSGLTMTGTTLSAGGGSTLVLLDTKTASASAQLDFTSVMTSSYDYYEMHLKDIIFSTSATPWVRGSTNNGSSYMSSANPYRSWYKSVETDTGTETKTITGGANQVVLRGATGQLSGVIQFFFPLSTTAGNKLKWTVMDSATGNTVHEGYADMNGAAGVAVNALRFLPSTGTITSGSIRLYGVKNT